MVTPHSPCPILFGLRSTDPTILSRALAGVRSEAVDRWVIFRTNQGTGDHLSRTTSRAVKPYGSGIVDGRVTTAPTILPGGHVRIEIAKGSEPGHSLCGVRTNEDAGGSRPNPPGRGRRHRLGRPWARCHVPARGYRSSDPGRPLRARPAPTMSALPPCHGIDGESARVSLPNLSAPLPSRVIPGRAAASRVPQWDMPSDPVGPGGTSAPLGPGRPTGPGMVRIYRETVSSRWLTGAKQHDGSTGTHVRPLRGHHRPLRGRGLAVGRVFLWELPRPD